MFVFCIYMLWNSLKGNKPGNTKHYVILIHLRGYLADIVIYQDIR